MNKSRINHKESIFMVGIAVIIVADARFSAWVNLATRMWNFKGHKSNKY